jgi:hypothetical protein
MIRSGFVAVLAVLIATFTMSTLGSPAQAGATCHIETSGAIGILVLGRCVPVEGQGPRSEPRIPTKVVSCGRPAVQGNGTWNGACGDPYACWIVDPVRGRVPETAYARFVEQNGRWVLQNVWCPNDAQPALTMAAVRQQVLRLLPKVAVGIAWKTTALVNAETVVWAATEAERSLGTVTVVGRQVGLRIAFDHANWDFGDGVTDTTSSPGKAYTDSDPCHTAQCADYYGYTYTDTGERTITLTVAWHAEFSLDGGRTWAAVDQAPLTGPQATHTLTVEQARGILVNNP